VGLASIRAENGLAEAADCLTRESSRSQFHGAGLRLAEEAGGSQIGSLELTQYQHRTPTLDPSKLRHRGAGSQAANPQQPLAKAHGGSEKAGEGFTLVALCISWGCSA